MSKQKLTKDDKVKLVASYLQNKVEIKDIERQGINRFTFYGWTRQYKHEAERLNEHKAPTYKQAVKPLNAPPAPANNELDPLDLKDKEIMKLRLLVGRLMVDIETLKAQLYGRRFQDQVMGSQIGSLDGLLERE